jgi:predicted acylesterase/phospholipase RssA
MIRLVSILLLASLATWGVSAALAEERVLDTFRARQTGGDSALRRLPSWEAPGQPTLALALSGGGARGLAHIGVLQGLSDDGVRIDGIAGTSIGALIGVFAAGGYEPNQIADILASRDWDAIIGNLDARRRILSREDDIARSAPQFRIRFRAARKLQIGALVDSSLLERELYRYLLLAQVESGGDLDRLRYRFRSVATDIITGKPVVPSHGDLATLVRGSAAIPGIFRPVPLGEALLVDGGLVENVPVETARTFGTDLVVAVNVSEGMVEDAHVKGAVDLLNRSVNVMMWERSSELLEMADLVLDPEVLDFSSAEFAGNIDGLVRAGQLSYREKRDELWDLLETRSDAPKIQFDRVEVVGTARVEPEMLIQRLGGTPGEVPRFRIVSELARLLNRGPFEDGEVEWLETASGRVLRFRLDESAVVQDVEIVGPAEIGERERDALVGEPFSLEAARAAGWSVRKQLIDDGGVLVSVEDFAWDPASGRVSADVRDAVVGRVTVSVEGDVSKRTIERAVSVFRGEKFRFDLFADVLDEMVARGAILEWSLEPRAGEDGAVDIELRVKADRYYQATALLEYRAAYRFAGAAGISKSNITGRGDFLDFLIGAAKETNFVQIRYRTEYGFNIQSFGGEFGYRYFNNEFPFVTDEQDLAGSLAEDYRGHRAWLNAIKRLRYGIALEFGVTYGRENIVATAVDPEETRSRYSVFLNVDLDRHDRLMYPTRGSALVFRGESSFSGDKFWKYELFADASFSLRPRRVHTFTIRGGAGISDGADRRPYFFNPGGYERLYGYIPYGAAAPQFARAGATWRYQWLEVSGVRIFVEAGADAIRTAFDRGDFGDAATGYGYGASLSAMTGFLGPLTLGAARNNDDATIWFFTLGYPLFER